MSEEFVEVTIKSGNKAETEDRIDGVSGTFCRHNGPNATVGGALAETLKDFAGGRKMYVLRYLAQAIVSHVEWRDEGIDGPGEFPEEESLADMLRAAANLYLDRSDDHLKALAEE